MSESSGKKNRVYPKLVIFDLDGTLVNAYPAIYESVKFVLKDFSYPLLGKAAIKRAVGWGDRNLLARFIKRGDLDEALLTYRRHHAHALVKYSRLLPGAVKLLRSLNKAKISLAVASNRPERFSRILLKALKIEKFFDYVLCGDMVRKHKPHPMMLRKIMRELGVKPKDTVYVGDMTIDIKAGRRSRVTTVAVCGGSSLKAELRDERPDFLLSGIGQLYRILGLR